MPHLWSGTGLQHPAILSRAPFMPVPGRIRSVSRSELIADDGDATPPLEFRFGGVPFRLLPLHSLACFPDFCFLPRAQRFSQDVSARACPVAFPTGYVILQSSAKIFPEPVTSAGGASDRTAVYRQARLNSRNCLIITTRLHIVNQSSTHLKRAGVQGFRASGSRAAGRVAFCAPPLKL